MKHCSNENCKQQNPQPYESFSHSRRAKDGYQSICKTCQCYKTREWYQANKKYAIEKRKERWRANKDEEIAKVAKWQRDNPEKIKGYHLKRKYGITLTEYSRLLKAQNNKCKICNKEESAVDRKNGKLRDLAVDHNHQTSKIRGLLCTKCNTAIGLLEHNLFTLRAAINYLEAEGAN